MIRYVLGLKNILLILSAVLLTYGLVGIGHAHTDTGTQHSDEDAAAVPLSVSENLPSEVAIGAPFTVHETDHSTAYKLIDTVEDSLEARHFRIDASDATAPQDVRF